MDPDPLSQGEKSPPSRGGIYDPGNQSCPSNITLRFSDKIMSADSSQAIESSCSFINNIWNMQVKTKFWVECDTKNC